MDGEAINGEANLGLPLGVVVYDEAMGADRILAEAAEILGRKGVRLGGVVQTNVDVPGRSKCAMKLRDLTSGEEIAISQDLGEHAAGCRLDVAALAQACAGVERAVRAGVDVVFINKFGKQEALGQGFRSAMAEALSGGAPVIVAVSRLNLGACLDFVGGAVSELPPEPEQIAAWCRVAGAARMQSADR
jgi:nucleoside-triphosphatase THEP1